MQDTDQAGAECADRRWSTTPEIKQFFNEKNGFKWIQNIGFILELSIFYLPPPEGRVSLNKPGATCSGREKINTKLTQHLQGCARENKKNCSAISPHTEMWQQLGKLGSARGAAVKSRIWEMWIRITHRHRNCPSTCPSEIRNDEKLTKP